MILRQQHQC